jgi:hypothetical protein
MNSSVLGAVDGEDFGKEGFDVKAWVNAQVRASATQAEGKGDGEGAKKTDNLSPVVVKLQLQSQFAGKAIAESSTKLLVGLPQAMEDIKRVGAEAALLAQQMAQVLDRISEVERTGQQTVAALATLDAIKTRMEECAVTLMEAQSVSKTLAQIEPLFQVDELRSIVARLNSLRQSLKSMGQMEEFQDAVARLEAFEDRLEKRASSKLNEGIERLDSQATRECLEIYEQMERRDVLITRYVQARKPALLRVYSSAAENASAEADGIKGLVAWLDALHDALRDGLDKELQWSAEVFPDAATFVAALWSELMDSIAEPLYGRVAVKLFAPSDADPAQHLKMSSEVLEAVARMARTATASLCSERLAGERPAPAAVFSSTMVVLGRVQREYADTEEAVMARAAEGWKTALRAKATQSEVLLMMEEVAQQALVGLQQAVERSLSFTCGAEGLAVSRMLDQSLASALETLHTGIMRLRQLANIDAPPAKSGGGDKHKGKGGAADAAGAQRQLEVDETDGVMSGPDGKEDWTWLQGALAVLALADSLASKVQTLQGNVRAMLRRHGEAAVSESAYDRSVEAPVAGYLRRDAARLAALRALVGKAERRDFLPLVRAPSLLQALRSAAEQLLVDVALGVVKQKLEDFSRLRVWGEHKERPAHMPAFSSSPLPYVTAIAEHLFSLPEQLDLSGGKDGQEDPGADDSGEKFMQHWVSRIGGELIALYSARVLALAALSPSGRVQLATDLQYLASILATLGAERLPQLEGLRALVEAPDGEPFAQAGPPPPLSRTKWTRRVPHPVLIGHEPFAQACLSVPLDRADIDRVAMARKRGGAAR